MSTLTDAGWKLDDIAADLSAFDSADPERYDDLKMVDELRQLRDVLWREADEGYPPPRPVDPEATPDPKAVLAAAADEYLAALDGGKQAEADAALMKLRAAAAQDAAVQTGVAEVGAKAVDGAEVAAKG